MQYTDTETNRTKFSILYNIIYFISHVTLLCHRATTSISKERTISKKIKRKKTERKRKKEREKKNREEQTEMKETKKINQRK